MTPRLPIWCLPYAHYVKPVLKLLPALRVKGIAHITGGGLVDNVPRILSDKLTARVDRSAWPLPALFAWLKKEGNLEDAEMFRVFNCGIGMVLVVSAHDADAAIALLAENGERVWRIGVIDERRGGESQTVIT